MEKEGKSDICLEKKTEMKIELNFNSKLERWPNNPYKSYQTEFNPINLQLHSMT